MLIYMNKAWILILLFFVSHTVPGQTTFKLDSLKKVASVSHDTLKFQLFVDLSFAYTSQNMDSALKYSHDALSLLPRLTAKRYKAAAFNSVAVIHYYNKDYDSALHYFRLALTVNVALNRKYGVAINYGQIGSVYHMKNEVDSAINYQKLTMKSRLFNQGVK